MCFELQLVLKQANDSHSMAINLYTGLINVQS